MDRRFVPLFVAGLGVQVGIPLVESGVSTPSQWAAVVALGVAVVCSLLAGVGVEPDPRLTSSRFAGVAHVALGIAIALVPMADGRLATVDGVGAVRVGAGLLLITLGLAVATGKERFRILEPGESERERRERVGWSTHPFGVVSTELARAIGVFGLLFFPTLVFALALGYDLLNPIVYAPAVAVALLVAAVVSAFRIRTGAGPHVGQLRDALGR